MTEIEQRSSPPTPAAAPFDNPSESARDMARQNERRQLNKSVLFNQLSEVGITHVIVTFDGYGDSGQVESIEARSGNLAVELPPGPIEIAIATWGGPEDLRRTVATTEAIETLAYDVLNDVASGWENNDGAFGDFTFDVAARTITLDYSQRRMESVFSQFEF